MKTSISAIRLRKRLGKSRIAAVEPLISASGTRIADAENAVWALGKIGTPLSNPHCKPQGWGSKGPGKCGLGTRKNRNPAVEPSLQTSRMRIKVRKMRLALGKIGTRLSNPHCKPQGWRPSCQRTCHWDTRKIKDVRAIEPLIAALRDEDSVSGKMRLALGKIGSAAVICWSRLWKTIISIPH